MDNDFSKLLEQWFQRFILCVWFQLFTYAWLQLDTCVHGFT